MKKRNVLTKKPTADEIEEQFKLMTAAGLMRDTGERRKGRIVYALTEEGRRMVELDAMPQ